MRAVCAYKQLVLDAHLQHTAQSDVGVRLEAVGGLSLGERESARERESERARARLCEEEVEGAHLLEEEEEEKIETMFEDSWVEVGEEGGGEGVLSSFFGRSLTLADHPDKEQGEGGGE